MLKMSYSRQCDRNNVGSSQIFLICKLLCVLYGIVGIYIYLFIDYTFIFIFSLWCFCY